MTWMERFCKNMVGVGSTGNFFVPIADGWEGNLFLDISTEDLLGLGAPHNTPRPT